MITAVTSYVTEDTLRVISFLILNFWVLFGIGAIIRPHWEIQCPSMQICKMWLPARLEVKEICWLRGILTALITNSRVPGMGKFIRKLISLFDSHGFYHGETVNCFKSAILSQFLAIQIQYFFWNLFSRPRQSQRLLYKHLCYSFIHYFIESLILCKNIFLAPPCPNGAFSHKIDCHFLLREEPRSHPINLASQIWIT